MNAAKIKGARRGFTLSELLLSAAILAFTFSVLLFTFVSCILLNQANRNLTIAVSHAQFVMEEIKGSDFTTLKTDIDNGSWDWDSSEITGNGLTPLATESIDAQASGTDPLDVTVTVNWLDNNARSRTTYLESLFTQQ